MVYNYTGRPMEVDFSKISGAKKNAWWYTTKDGKLEYIGEFDNGVHKFPTRQWLLQWKRSYSDCSGQ